MLYNSMGACQNGTCVSEMSSPACLCDGGYEGYYCEVKTSDTILTIVVPVVVVGVVVLVVLIVVAVLVVRRNRKQNA